MSAAALLAPAAPATVHRLEGNLRLQGRILGPIPFTDATGSAYQFLEGNLSPLGLSLIALADAHFRRVDVSSTIPVVTSLTEIPKAADADHGMDELASATQRRFTVQFARMRP